MTNWKRILLFALLSVLTFTLAIQPCLADGETEEPATPGTEPLAQFACIADLGRVVDSLEQAEDVRKMLYDFSLKLAEDKLDAVILGGDVTDEAMSKEMWQYGMKQLSEVLSEASDTVLYTVGNTDYMAGEEAGYNSADYYTTLMKDRLGELYYWDFYYETHGGIRCPLAYRYYVGDVCFYFLNTAPTDMAGALHHGNFVYTQGALSWVEEKMEADDPSGDKTMFLVAHFPPEGDGTGTGGLETAVSERLTQICAQHANLIYLYGNTQVAEDTAETVIPFTDEGLVLTETEREREGLGLASLWTPVSCGEGLIALQNVKNGRYLSIEEGVRLSLSAEPTAWIAQTVNGRTYLLAEDRVNGLRVSKSNTFGFTLGRATPLEFYVRSSDHKGTLYTYSPDLVPGIDYAVVSDSKYVLCATADGVATGEARVMGDELTETARKTTAEGTPAFTAVSMGTVAEGGENIQYLTLTVFADRVELQLNNYNLATKETVPMTAFVREGLPTPVRTPKPSVPKPVVEEVFDWKLYLLVMLGAVLVGGAFSTMITIHTGRHRFFE